MLDMTHHIRPSGEEIAGKVIDGEAVIINLSNGRYYSMDGVGALIWEQIEGGLSLEELSAIVVSRYEVEPDRARRDLEKLAEELMAEQLVVLQPGDGGGAAPEPASSRQAYEPPRLNVFSDMGELLALDPPVPGLMDTVEWAEPEL